MRVLVELSYFATAILFIIGLKRMSHPKTARSGIVWAGAGMLLATLMSFFHPQIAGNYLLMISSVARAPGSPASKTTSFTWTTAACSTATVRRPSAS